MIDQKTQTNIDSNDILQVITQLQPVIAAKNREIAEWREKFAGAQALNVDQKSA